MGIWIIFFEFIVLMLFSFIISRFVVWICVRRDLRVLGSCGLWFIGSVSSILVFWGSVGSGSYGVFLSFRRWRRVFLVGFGVGLFFLFLESSYRWRRLRIWYIFFLWKLFRLLCVVGGCGSYRAGNFRSLRVKVSYRIYGIFYWRGFCFI